MLVRLLSFFILFFILEGCNFQKKETVKDFFENGGNVSDTSIKLPLFLYDSLRAKNPYSIVVEIANCNELDASGVGFDGRKTEQYARYENLLKYASDSDLISFTRYNNAVVRVYAFYALIEKNSPLVISIFKDHVNDAEEIETFSGCLKLKEAVNKCMLASLKPYKGCKSPCLSKKEYKKYLKIITGSENEMGLSW